MSQVIVHWTPQQADTAMRILSLALNDGDSLGFWFGGSRRDAAIAQRALAAVGVAEDKAKQRAAEWRAQHRREDRKP